MRVVFICCLISCSELLDNADVKRLALKTIFGRELVEVMVAFRFTVFLARSPTTPQPE